MGSKFLPNGFTFKGNGFKSLKNGFNLSILYLKLTANTLFVIIKKQLNPRRTHFLVRLVDVHLTNFYKAE